jgi:hypothetical protein
MNVILSFKFIEGYLLWFGFMFIVGFVVGYDIEENNYKIINILKKLE